MALNSFVALKSLCELSGWSISNLQAQKLLYLSQMMFLGNYGGTPLINESFEAWDYGPVLPSVYHSAKSFGEKPLPNIYKRYETVSSDTKEHATFVDLVEWNKDKKPFQLVSITHWEGGAWAKNYVAGAKGIVIPNEDILEEFNKRAA